MRTLAYPVSFLDPLFVSFTTLFARERVSAVPLFCFSCDHFDEVVGRVSLYKNNDTIRNVVVVSQSGQRSLELAQRPQAERLQRESPAAQLRPALTGDVTTASYFLPNNQVTPTPDTTTTTTNVAFERKAPPNTRGVLIFATAADERGRVIAGYVCYNRRRADVCFSSSCNRSWSG